MRVCIACKYSIPLKIPSYLASLGTCLCYGPSIGGWGLWFIIKGVREMVCRVVNVYCLKQTTGVRNRFTLKVFVCFEIRESHIVCEDSKIVEDDVETECSQNSTKSNISSSSLDFFLLEEILLSVYISFVSPVSGIIRARMPATFCYWHQFPQIFH